MRDIFLPQFMDRRPYNEWETKKDDGRDWALAKARKILETHQPDPLDAKMLSAEMGKNHRIVEKTSNDFDAAQNGTTYTTT